MATNSTLRIPIGVIQGNVLTDELVPWTSDQ